MTLTTHFNPRKLFIVSLPFLIAVLSAQIDPEPAPPASETETPSTTQAAEVVTTVEAPEAVESVAPASEPVRGPEVENPTEGAEISAETETVAPSSELELPELPESPERLTGVEPDRSKRVWLDDMVRVFADVTIGPNQEAGDMVVIGGNAIVAGRVNGDSVVVLGNATIDGQLNGDLVNIMGSTVLGPEAVINGELIAVGGHVARADGAIVRGETIELSFLPDMTSEQFRWLGTWFKSGLLLGRPLPHSQSWAWVTAGVLLIIALLISFVFRRAIDSTVAVLDQRPAASLLTGMLVFILSGPLTFILAVSVVGLIVVPFLMMGLLVTSVFGVIGVYRFSGQQFGLQAQPALALLAGGILFTLLYAVPIIGFLTWFLVGTLGTGAVVLALIQGLRRESSGTKKSGPPPMSPISPLAKPAPVGPAGPVSEDLDHESDIDSATPAEDEMTIESVEDPLMAERVGFWPRLGATALDFILVASLAGFTGLNEWFPLLWIVYHITFWSWRQTTIGGIVLNLKVVRLDGEPLRFGVVTVRSLASIFSGLVIGLGMFWASWDTERQSWHDKIAGTTIVRVPRGTPLL